MKHSTSLSQFPQPENEAVGRVSGSYARTPLWASHWVRVSVRVTPAGRASLNSARGGEKGRAACALALPTSARAGGSAWLRAPLPRPAARALVASTSGPSTPLAKPTRRNRLHVEQPDQERNRVARERERKAVRGCALPPLSRSRRG